MSYSPQPQRSQLLALSAGGSITIPDGTTLAVVTNAALLATGTIVLPLDPADGMPLTIESPKGITLLTLAPNTGQTISGTAITVASPNVPIRLKYSNINATWYPN